MGSQVDSLKAAISSGTASPRTILILESLLNIACVIPPILLQHGQTPSPKPKRNTAKALSHVTHKLIRKGPATIHEDALAPLTPKQQYGLATEVVKLCLTELSNAVSLLPTPQKTRTGLQTSPAVRIVLESCSGNHVLLRQSPDGKKTSQTSSSSCFGNGHLVSKEHVSSVAECALLAFRYLRSADPEGLGIRIPPKWQIESGVTSLIGKLLALRMDTLAVSELHRMKLRLESYCTPSRTKLLANLGTAAVLPKESLASLFYMNVEVIEDLEALHTLLSYLLLAARAVASTAKPRVVEAVASSLTEVGTDSSTHWVARNLKAFPPDAGTAKQIDAISHCLLSLCPSISASADIVASDRSLSPCPVDVLKLQCTALDYRIQGRRAVHHDINCDLEVWQPFGKCMHAFQRRCGASSIAYDVAKTCHDRLTKVLGADLVCKDCAVLKTLADLAEQSGCLPEAQQWARRSLESYEDLEQNHARRLAASCLLIRLDLMQGVDASVGCRSTDSLVHVKDSLMSPLTGQGVHYEELLAALRSLTHHLARLEDKDLATDLICAAARFAQRYARSYPGRQTIHVQAIISEALGWSASSKDRLAWVSWETVDILGQNGTLATVVEHSATKSLQLAWATSSKAIALGVVVQTLVLQAVHTDTKAQNLAYDPETLDATSRATLLEWQLQYASGLAFVAKYRHALQKIVPSLLQRLAEILTVESFALRRARVATIALRLQGSYPELLAPHLTKTWHDCPPAEESELVNDSGLHAYLRDVNAGLALARSFCGGRPSADDLKPCLLEWQECVRGVRCQEDLARRVDSPLALLSQLGLVSSYLAALGETAARLQVLEMSARLNEIGIAALDGCAPFPEMAVAHLALGSLERALLTLQRGHDLADHSSPPTIADLQLRIAYAEYYISVDDVDQARKSLQETATSRDELSPENVPAQQRKAYELLHARGWLVHSKFLLTTGAAHESLSAAKQAVRMLNTTWSALERSTSGKIVKTIEENEDPAVPDVATMTTGVSKLNLRPQDNHESSRAPDDKLKGVAFWSVIPLLCDGLSHLSEVYAHHGLFAEADYYSQRAVKVAEQIGPTKLAARHKVRRSLLLLQAGQLEAAELCLEQCSELDGEQLDVIELYRVKAAICAKEGGLEEALGLYDKAEEAIKRAESQLDATVTIDGDAAGHEVVDGKIGASTSRATRSAMKNVEEAAGKARGRDKKPVGKTKSVKKLPGLASTAVIGPNSESPRHYLLSKLRRRVRTESALASLLLGGTVSRHPAAGEPHLEIPTLQERRVSFQTLMREASSLLQADVSFNSMLESTLAFPGLMSMGEGCSIRESQKQVTSSARACAEVKSQENAGIKKSKLSSSDSIVPTLLAVHACVADGVEWSSEKYSTAEAHRAASMTAEVNMLLSAMSVTLPKDRVGVAHQATQLELPRDRALQCEAYAVRLDNGSKKTTTPAWPDMESLHSNNAHTRAYHYEDGLDALPELWTAISLTLNENSTELFATRYRRGQKPFILRLPFCRNAQDGEKGEAFDYVGGMAELDDIIQASNFSCHSSGNAEVKGAKVKWWNEREALDKRLHAILINMENIWFGGFKSLFSQHGSQPKQLSRFRETFEDILTRYLPSRNGSKANTERLRLNDQVMDLFVGLGSDEDGTIDFDEPLTDLLYFVVDVLQFSGERNSYDEIDFDAMIIDVMEALRSYHDACVQTHADGKHLILILDKRLHAFPWESMPCLEGKSVSRVGSMQSLLERIHVMRTQGGKTASCNKYAVGRRSGTYILNPSSDLVNTQAVLSPLLATLSDQEHSSWSSLVGTAPSEEAFTSALSSSSILLYFGHGAGTQYIRPKNIKRLEKCSEVVWLMGCSSGAVTEYGELEPFAVPLAYMMAGKRGGTGKKSPHAEGEADDNGQCMAVVTTLWDVTDKDIDRFSVAVGEEWGLWPASEASKLPTKATGRRTMLAAPSTPQQVPKTPKTPKVGRTPAPIRIPARGQRQQREAGKKKHLGEAMANSRDACYLRYLNGAAPVVYGLPVYLED